jgi:hypothetical protein
MMLQQWQMYRIKKIILFFRKLQDSMKDDCELFTLRRKISCYYLQTIGLCTVIETEVMKWNVSGLLKAGSK